MNRITSRSAVARLGVRTLTPILALGGVVALAPVAHADFPAPGEPFVIKTTTGGNKLCLTRTQDQIANLVKGKPCKPGDADQKWYRTSAGASNALGTVRTAATGGRCINGLDEFTAEASDCDLAEKPGADDYLRQLLNWTHLPDGRVQNSDRSRCWFVNSRGTFFSGSADSCKSSNSRFVMEPVQ